jgi:hypothetical protein
MKVSPRLVSAAKQVKTKGSDGLRQAVIAGKASVSAAAMVASLPKTEQDRLVSEGATALAKTAKTIRQRIRHAKKNGWNIRSTVQPMKPVRESQPLPAKTALELPHDPVWAGRTLISVFDREFLVGLVQVLSTHLNEGVSQ